MAGKKSKSYSYSSKPKSKKKATNRALNAFDIALKQDKYQNGDASSDDDDNGAIVNPNKKSDDEDEEFEDEELDSDEALGSDDDYDVLNSKFSQTIRDRKKNKSKQNNESDEDEGYNSIDESELVSLSAAWDLDDKDLKSSKGGKDIVLDDNWESESEQESDEDSDEESDEESESDDEDIFPDEEDHDDSDIELTTLKNQLQKKQSKSKKLYQNSKIQENELALPGGGDEITLADMLSVVDAQSSKDAVLIDKDETEGSNNVLPIPLPKRIQDRHERKAAYEISKDEVNKWKDTVKQNRNAEVLSFPLNPTVEHNAVSTFSETPAITELEQKVNSLLTQSSLLDEKAESKFEQIQTAKLSSEDLRKRQNELRKMRELMFRQEREAKRMKKIKSKSYRRIKKKELLKTQSLVEGDEDSDVEDHDSKRALERMSLKHKNNSKWAQSMIKSGISKDQDAREEMEEMLRRGEALKSKILNREDGDDEFHDSNDLDLEKEYHNDSDESEERENLGKTGVLNMAFMKNAESRERSENETFKNKLRKLNADEDIKSFENSHDDDAVNVHINNGRRIYTPGVAESSQSIKELNEEVLKEHETDTSNDLSNRLSKKHNKESILNKASKPTDDSKEYTVKEDVNPWLATEDDNKNVQKSRKIKVVDETSSKLEKTQAKLSKQKNKRKADQLEEDDQIIDMEQTLKIVDPHGDDSDRDVDEDDESNIKIFKQKNLIKQAFAGDDVVTEFKQEKKQTIKDEGDQIEDLTLPGWGDWAGGNIKRKKNKIVKKTKGVEFNKRKDKNLKNVIINEKVNKKNLKYQSSAVPFPYQNKEQYERSLRMPIGQEWTSRETHQRLTMPRVIVKSGVVIDPLRAPK